MWGELHVILDDDNANDCFINEDIVRLHDNQEAIEILKGLKNLTESQRLWITYNIWNVSNGKGEREIYEEFPDEDEEYE